MDGLQNYHVCTRGLVDKLLYHDVSDFICGMNDIPICLMKTSAEMLCFCLMSNHVHFVMRGSEDACVAFMNEFKRRTSQRIREKYKDEKLLKDLGVTIKPINQNPVDLCRVVAYVLRNPVAARMGWTPANYPWSSANLYFRKEKYDFGLQTVAGMGKTRVLQVIRSRAVLPDDYKINGMGIIDPGCYIRTEAVEKAFGSVGQFLYYMSYNGEAEFEAENMAEEYTSYSYREIKNLTRKMCLRLHRTEDFDSLSLRQKRVVGAKLKKQYGVSPKQFAKAIGVKLAVLESAM